MVRSLKTVSSCDPSQSVVDAAIDWAVKMRFGTPTPAMRVAFDEWLAVDASHVLAWQRVQQMFGDISSVSPTVTADVLQTVQEHRANQRTGRRAVLRKLVTWGAVSPFMLWAIHDYTPWQRLVSDYSTRVGERRQLRLDDGTVIDLNTDTALSVQLGGDSRVVSLRRGEIYVRTGKDDTAIGHRPFFVRTPQGTAQALGTRFVVRLEDSRSFLHVEEGAVRISPTDGLNVVLNAAQSGWMTTKQAILSGPTAVDPLGWTQGVISVTGIRLVDLLSEVERYRRGRIVCASAVADRRISGTFHVDDTDALLRFLASTQSLAVVTRTPFWVWVGPRDDVTN